MATKQFATGEILYAADVNTYLTNGGMRYIKQVSGTSTTVLNVNDCFSATYDSYFVLVSNVVLASGNLVMFVRLRVGGADAAGTDYYFAYTSTSHTTGSAVAGTNGGAGATVWNTGHIATTNAGAFGFHVYNPFIARMTGFSCFSADPRTTGNSGVHCSGYHNLATSYTGFSLFGFTSPTMSSVTATVYGYRTTA